jgi:hypothetical protein
MKNTISLLLAILMTFQSFGSEKRFSEDYISHLVFELESLNTEFSQNCLTEFKQNQSYEEYILENGISERCYVMFNEIQVKEEELSRIGIDLEQKISSLEIASCRQDQTVDLLSGNLNKLSEVTNKLSCTKEREREVKNSCGRDLNCFMFASALGVGGIVAEKLMPESMKIPGCNLQNDSCATQLATGFIKAVLSFFDGVWDLLKMAGEGIKKQWNNFWNWVTDAEDHTSTSQLAMSEASEEDGVFDMLVNDFSGTMTKIWQGLVGALKEWVKNDVLCEEWEGIPRFSECKRPYTELACTSCKTFATGLCGASGVILAEIVPAFLTGGIVSAAKFGIGASVKIAKGFSKVSSSAARAVKASKIGKTAKRSSQSIGRALKLSQNVNKSITPLRSSLNLTSKYLSSPLSKKLSQVSRGLEKLRSKHKVFMAETKTGRVLVFGTRALKNAGKIAIYPIENPLTVAAFKSGMTGFDNVFNYGQKAFINLSKVASKTQKIKPSEISKIRGDLTSEFFENKYENLDDIVENLYPELRYTKNYNADDVVKAEKEIWEKITQVENGDYKDKLIEAFHYKVVGSTARKRIIDKTPLYTDIVRNTQLSDIERYAESLRVLGKKKGTDKLKEAIIKAHNIGENGSYNYTWSEIREKYRILTNAGLNSDEADLLIRSGLAGRPPTRQLVSPNQKRFTGVHEDLVVQKPFTERMEIIHQALKEKEAQSSNIFVKALKKVQDDKESKLIDEINSLYFIDHEHSVETLVNVTRGNKAISTSNNSKRYGDLEARNFKAARKYLKEETPEVTLDTFKEIHKRMMNGRVEGIERSDIGNIRQHGVVGNVPSKYAIDQKTIDNINQNVYLSWDKHGVSGNSEYGYILYPNLRTIQKKTLDLIRDDYPVVVKKVEEVQKVFKKLSREDISSYIKDYNEVYYKLNGQLIDALTKDRFAKFDKARALLGEINTAEKMDQYVDLVSNFQRDLVSIHPFQNGNGRTTRELMNYLLTKEGLPPARLANPNADVYQSAAEWSDEVYNGIIASQNMLEDLYDRAKLGLSIHKSPHFVIPQASPKVNLSLKSGSKLKVLDEVEYIDPKLYRELVLKEIAIDPKFSSKLYSDPAKAWGQIQKKAKETYKKNNIYYKHPKNGVERVEIGFVDEDFKDMFGIATFNDPNKFKYKMDNWYREDIVWRGLASKSAEKSDSEIINMFKELNLHMASNAVLRKVSKNDPKAIKAAALEDFEKYNDDVFDEGLVAMAKDHSETGPMYGESYGYSTSKNREVGKAFSMGAMVIAEYGAHKAPELQALLKSRVLVGARWARKDVDLGRLKQLREDFSYKYGRQQEVMGIGASDPDAITIIQRIDAEGEAYETFLRNPENPSEIWHVKGDIRPGEKPNNENLIRLIDLNNN